MRQILLCLLIVLFCPNTLLAGTKTSPPLYKLQVDRYGPVVIGMTPAEASAKLDVPLIPEGLLDPHDKESQACHYEYSSGVYQDIGFMVEDGKITRIDIRSNKITTMNNIRIGDSEETVRTVFPGKVLEEIHPYIGKEGKYLIVETKPGYAFIFETDRGKITSFRSGKLSSVRYIEGCL
jgi:hypothetical protein